jgi:hypothetical protein
LLDLPFLDGADEFLVRRTVLGLTYLLRPFGPLDLGVLAHAGLTENGQQHRGVLRGEPVRDPYVRAVKRGPQLADTVADVAGVRLTQGDGVLREQAAVLVDLEEVLGGNACSQSRTSGSSSMLNSGSTYSTLYVVVDIHKPESFGAGFETRRGHRLHGCPKTLSPAETLRLGSSRPRSRMQR